MPRFKVEIKGLKEVQGAIQDVLSKEAQVKRQVLYSAIDIQRSAKENIGDLDAIDTGNMRNQVVIDIVNAGFGAEIKSGAPYSPFIEYGTRPHFPPPDALESWARHHGFDSAWPICRIIAKRGLPARPFLVPAHDQHAERFYEKVKEIMRK